MTGLFGFGGSSGSSPAGSLWGMDPSMMAGSSMLSPQDRLMALFSGLSRAGAAMARGPGGTQQLAAGFGALGEGINEGNRTALQQHLLNSAAQEQANKQKGLDLYRQVTEGLGGPMPMPAADANGQPGPTAAAQSAGAADRRGAVMSALQDPRLLQAAALNPALASSVADMRASIAPVVAQQGSTLYDPMTFQKIGQGQSRNDLLQILEANTTLTPAQKQEILARDASRISGDPELAGKTTAAQEWAKFGPSVLRDRLQPRAVNPGGSLAIGGTGDLAGLNLLGPLYGQPRVGQPSVPGATGTPQGGAPQAKPAAAGSPQELYKSPVPAPGTPENAFNKTTGEFFGKTYNDLQSAGMAASAKNQGLDRLDQLMSKVAQGRGEGTLNELKAWAKSAGVPLESFGISDTTPYADAIRSVTNQMALQLRNPAGGAGMPGALSDQDLKILQSMPPGIDRTEGGNKLIVDYTRRMNQRDQDVAKQARIYMKDHGNQLDNGFFDHLQEWSAKNPIFGKTDVEAIAKAGGAAAPAAPVTAKHVNPKTGQTIVPDGKGGWMDEATGAPVQ